MSYRHEFPTRCDQPPLASDWHSGRSATGTTGADLCHRKGTGKIVEIKVRAFCTIKENSADCDVSIVRAQHKCIPAAIIVSINIGSSFQKALNELRVVVNSAMFCHNHQIWLQAFGPGPRRPVPLPFYHHGPRYRACQTPPR